MNNKELETFWNLDEKAHLNNCFNPDAAQVALGIRMSDECVFSELGVDGDPWGITPRDVRIKLNIAYNDKAEKIVGKRLLSEHVPEADAVFPAVKRIGELFGGTYDLLPNAGEWLHSHMKTVKDLEQCLDKVERLNFQEVMLPQNWESEKKRIYEKYGTRPDPLRWVRGPVTLAMSLFGEENLIYLYYDEPELYQRFSQTISHVIIQMADIMDQEAFGSVEKAPHGFGFADDNCYLLTPEMYHAFGYPVLESVFAKYCPKQEDSRYQHSDSPMGHLLPQLAELGLTGCNFGPTVLVDEIRKHMPTARIDGCIAPFTFMNNDETAILQEVKRDCDMIKRSGSKGLNISTAGSINNGSSLQSMLTVMKGIREFGQY